MKSEPVSFWLDLLKEVTLDQPYVFIAGKPSVKKKEDLAAMEKERIQLQQENLGPEGLAQKKWDLERAMEANEVSNCD